MISIPWKSPQTIFINGEPMIAPCIEGQDYNMNTPAFFWQKKLGKSSNFDIQFESFHVEAALKEEIVFLNKKVINVPETIDQQSKIVNARTDVFASLTLFPFVLKNGVIHRITSVAVTITELGHTTNKKEKSFASESVLAEGTGTWCKIGVTEDGIYKIDKTFLLTCGIETDGLNPHSINIYGNGDGKLPELNSTPRTDDLAKNAIYIEGEDDGVFDDGDYILFYGWGPSRWFEVSNGFVQDKNIYSDISYYYININSSEPPLRISNQYPIDDPANYQSDSYSFHAVHEQDLVNLFAGGQRWYGEKFDIQLEHTINFSVPNIDISNPAIFNVSLASDGVNSQGTNQLYSINGTTIFTDELPTSSSGNFNRDEYFMQLAVPTATMPFKISVTRNSPVDQIFLDKVTLNCRRNLVLSSNQFNFRDLLSVNPGNVSQFEISNVPNSGTLLWNITDRHHPKKIMGYQLEDKYIFRVNTDSLLQFVVSNGSTFFIPQKIGSVQHQNLHALATADILIVTHPNFVSQAQRLADLHTSIDGKSALVVTTEQIYNEFSSGMLDPTAIRSFCKMFYDRAAGTASLMPEYLILFGKGTYDPKNRVDDNQENYFIPTYQFLTSESKDNSGGSTSDDYFGLLDDNEAINDYDLLDISVGRLLVYDQVSAKIVVDKIEHYLKNGSKLSSSSDFCGTEPKTNTFGDWRLKSIFIADDGDNNTFVEDTEIMTKYITSNFPLINTDKIYLDAYVQQITAGGQRFPEVNTAITTKIKQGALLVTYVGHGGENGVADERVISIPMIQEWDNYNSLPFMVFHTCELTRFDDPSRIVAGQYMANSEKGGAIALLTTTRPVLIGGNIVKAFHRKIYEKDADNNSLTFGEVYRLCKNQYSSLDNRDYTFIGDPALNIALPRFKVVTDSINGYSSQTMIDTLKALKIVRIKGHIEDYSSTILSNFNGVISPTILDKPKMQQTLGQESNSSTIEFETQKNAVFKGKASVKNGYFEFMCMIPKDIDLSYGKGKISYYADNGEIDAAGFDTSFLIGGISSTALLDTKGPEIDLFFNDSTFANSGLTNQNPTLVVKLRDESGINATGNGVGHDITAILDGNTSDPIVLNEYYQCDLDTYQAGTIKYDFSKIEEGNHTLTFKAWDINGNSSETTTEFIVQNNERCEIEHLLNYPNPFTDRTEFFFEHNQVCNNLETQIQIFTITGRLVKTINQNVKTVGFRTEGIAWDGRDEYGDQLAKGVYVYRLTIDSEDGKKAEKIEKLYLLK